MAIYRTIGRERLQTLADIFYSEISDEAINSIVYDNQQWDGDALLSGGLVLSVPDNIVDFPYNPARVVPSSLEIPTRPVRAIIGETRNMSAHRGVEVSEEEAVAQDVLDRVASYRGDREGRLDYGTRLLDAITYLAREEVRTAAEEAARVALAPAVRRYVVNVIRAYFIDDALFLEISAEPTFGTEEVIVTINLEVDLR